MSRQPSSHGLLPKVVPQDRQRTAIDVDGSGTAAGVAAESGTGGGWLARLTGRLPSMADDTGAISVGGRYSADQDALIQLAKQAKRAGGLSKDDANLLADWADEFGLPGHGPAVHPGRPGVRRHN